MKKKHGKAKHTPTAYTWDAQTGEINGRAEPKAQKLGGSEAMREIYERGVGAIASKLCSASPGESAGADNAAASALPPFVLLPQCTWMRALLRGGHTSAHSDVGFFLRRTDELRKLYAEHPQFRPSRHASAAVSRCAADLCCAQSSDDSELHRCICCGSSFHGACQDSLPRWLESQQPRSAQAPLDMARWHCDECLNAASPLYTCWMPLTDLAADSSRLKVVPRSHKLQGYEHMQAAEDGDTLPGGFDVQQQHEWLTAPADMRAGDIVLFSWKLIHAASQHTHDQLRLSLDTRIAIQHI
jgi:hypothetical protein